MNEQEKNYGVLPEVEPMRLYDYEIACGGRSLESNIQEFPEKYIIDVKKMGVLKDQGTIGCCVGCVMSSLAEVFKLIEDYGKDIPEDIWNELVRNHFIGYEFSEGWAYGGLREITETHWGMYPSRALEQWRKKGQILKKYFDVLKEMPEMIDSIVQFPELAQKALPYRIKNYTSINYSLQTKKDKCIKEALMQNGYGLLAIAPTYFGEGHCIMIVGWNDKNNAYIVKNSWGPYWGNSYGVGEIPKEEIAGVYVIYDEELQSPFVDVKQDDWFAKDVKNMYFAGLINGVSETLFEPFRVTTRAEVSAIISRVIKMVEERLMLLKKVAQEKKVLHMNIDTHIIPNSYKTLPFIDVNKEDWYYNDIQVLYSLGLINGVTDIQFKPNDNITRAQMATLITRICDLIDTKIKEVLKACECDIYISQLQNNFTNISELMFTDVFTEDGEEKWYTKYILNTCQLGIMQGISDTLFEPERDINRAEMAVVLNRLSKFVDKRIQFTNERI